MKERIARMSEKDREIESRVLSKELKRFLGDAPKTIAVYMALSDEPNITPLLQELLQAGWTIALPAMENNALVFRTIRSFENLKKGDIGVLEPTENDPVADRSTIDMVIIPGRAFTRDGKRMGRGNGGYDKWITSQRLLNPKTQYTGVCFECQIVNDLPCETHDEKVNEIVTSRGPLMKI
jgi:5-formyltetrahydrofolate cyclo-ligase